LATPPPPPPRLLDTVCFLLALFQIIHLEEGKVNANHRFRIKFAWSYGPSILTMPVENAISYFCFRISHQRTNDILGGD